MNEPSQLEFHASGKLGGTCTRLCTLISDENLGLRDSLNFLTAFHLVSRFLLEKEKIFTFSSKPIKRFLPKGRVDSLSCSFIINKYNKYTYILMSFRKLSENYSVELRIFAIRTSLLLKFRRVYSFVKLEIENRDRKRIISLFLRVYNSHVVIRVLLSYFLTFHSNLRNVTASHLQRTS